MEKFGFSNSWISDLKGRVNIVSVAGKYIQLDRRGRLYWARCPFHLEKTPSFAINEMEQFFKCYGCGLSGDVIRFVEKIESIDFFDACKILADDCGMELPHFEKSNVIAENKKKKDTYLNILREAAKYYYKNLSSPAAAPALEYIQKRHLDAKTVLDFGIGYSLGWNEVVTYLTGLGFSKEDIIGSGVVEQKNNSVFDAQAKRLVFPIINSYNEVIGFSSRLLDKADFAKYKNTAQTLVFDKSRVVYNINNIKKLKNSEGLKEIILVEGQMDVISLYRNGVKNAVACMGTALTQYHAKELKRFTDKVVVCFDGDSAGIKATLRSLEILVGAGLNVYVALLPSGIDPDEYILTCGKDSYDRLISEAKYWVDYLLYYYSTKYNLDKSEQKTRFIAECLAVINTLDSESEKDIYLTKLRDMTNVSISVLKEDLNGVKTASIGDVPDNEKNQKSDTINLKENAYVKAVKFVISALLYKRPYAILDDSIRDNIKNSDYVKIYDYIKAQYDSNNVPKVSSLFDMFDVEENSDVYDIANYEFNPLEDNEKYYSDCTNTLISYGLLIRQEKITKRLRETKDNNERMILAKELQELITKRKGL